MISIHEHLPIHVDMSLSNFSVLKGFNEFIKTVIQLTVSHGPRPLTAPTGADLISSNPGRGSLRGGDPKGRSRKGMDLAGPEPPFSLLLIYLFRSLILAPSLDFDRV